MRANLVVQLGDETRTGRDVVLDERSSGQRDEACKAMRCDLEAARYAADRAFRQSDVADPENRLVAGELEPRENTALARVNDVEATIAAHDAAAPSRTEPTLPGFTTLARDLEAIWKGP